MKKWSRLTFITGVVMLILAVANIAVLSLICADMPGAEWQGRLVATLIIIMGAGHLLSLYGVARLFRSLRRDSFIRSAAFALGFLSVYLLAVDVVMLQDIGKEWTSGYDISGEWGIVCMAHGFHALFALFVMFQALSSRRKPAGSPPAAKDEALFLSVHQVGVVSASTGLFFAVIINVAGIPRPYIPGLLFISCVVLLIPYAVVALCWLFSKRKERPSDWYDEKQFADISRSGLFALVLSVILLAVWYLLLTVGAVELSSLVFPAYLFAVLLLFSSRALYLSKRA